MKRTYNNRWNAARDSNEPEIIRELQDAGVWVSRLNEKDVPDLLCGYKGVWFLVEVKTPTGSLEKGQQVFHALAATHGLPIFVADHIDDTVTILRQVLEAPSELL